MIALLPEKHVRLNETILGLGALVLGQLSEAKTLDELWEGLKELRTRKKTIPERIGFEDLILTVDFLFALRMIDLSEEGDLSRCV